MNTTQVAAWLDRACAGFDYEGLRRLYRLAEDKESTLLAFLGFFNLLAEKGIAFFLLGLIFLLIPRTRFKGYSLYAAVGTASCITLTLKHMIQRLRPFMHSASDYTAWHRLVGAPMEDGFSFPSGHSTVMMAGMTALALNFSGRWRAFLFLPVVFTGLYRCTILVHYPSDILGGLLTGGLGALIGHGLAKMSYPWLRSLSKDLPMKMPLLLLCLALAAAPHADAQDPPEQLFPLTPKKELLILGTGTLVNTAAFLLEEEECFDPERTYNKNTVNAFDRGSMAAFDAGLDDLSAGIALSALLTPAVLLSTSGSEWLSIGTMYAESLLLTWGLKELGKTILPRDRPYMYFDGAPAEDLEDGDFKRAFPSGHTALAFTGASFSSYVFNSYYPDSPWGLPVSIASYSLACTAGALRIASGNHYLSDVLAGAALGTLSGIFIPWLHKKHPFSGAVKDNPIPVSLSLSPAGITMMYSY